MEFLPGAVLLSLITFSCFYISRNIWKSYISTKDKSLKYFSISLLFNGMHVLIYIILQTTAVVFDNIQFLTIGRIISRACLNIGIILLLLVPFIDVLKFYKRLKYLFVYALSGFVFMGSLLQFFIEDHAVVVPSGFIIENIDSTFLIFLIIITPFTVSSVWVLALAKMSRVLSKELKFKAGFITIGTIFPAIGQTLYITSHSLKQTVIGVSTVLLGFSMIFIAASMKSVRKALTSTGA